MASHGNGAPGSARFSVVIPSHERPQRAQACIASLRRQHPPVPELQIVIVDDGSGEPARQALQDVVAGFDDVVLVWQPNAGPAAARNRGAAIASGDFVIFLDDDCRVPPDWFARMASAALRAPEAMVGGPIDNGCPEHVCSEASQLLIDVLYDYFDPDQGRARFFCSSNLCLPREAFLAFGGFDTRFELAGGEDRHFSLRWSESGRASSLAPDARITHHHAMTLPTYLRQQIHYGQGAFRLKQVRERDGEAPIAIEPFSFYRRIVEHAWRHAAAGRRVRVVALLLAAQVGNVAGFARAALVNRRASARMNARGR